MFFLIASPFLLFAFYMLWIGVSARSRSSRSRHWPQVRGKIVASHMKSEIKSVAQGSQISYVPVIRYEYHVEGRPYASSRLNFSVVQGISEDWARGIADRYPVGKEVVVYYDPKKPSESVLEHLSISLRLHLAVFVFVVGLLGFIYLMSDGGGCQKIDRILLERLAPAPSRSL